MLELRERNDSRVSTVMRLSAVDWRTRSTKASQRSKGRSRTSRWALASRGSTLVPVAPSQHRDAQGVADQGGVGSLRHESASKGGIRHQGGRQVGIAVGVLRQRDRRQGREHLLDLGHHADRVLEAPHPVE